MALNSMDQDTISRGLKIIAFLHENAATIQDLNVLYDAQGGLKSRITQEDLDAVGGFYGMTVAQLNDAMYVLTALIMPILTANRTQLVVPATVGR